MYLLMIEIELKKKERKNMLLIKGIAKICLQNTNIAVTLYISTVTTFDSAR